MIFSFGRADVTTFALLRIFSAGILFDLGIADAKSCPVISNIGIYKAPQILSSPSIIRNQKGEINIIPADKESELYYTMDGSAPTLKSKKYSEPFATEGKVQISAIAYEPASGKSSPVTHEKFDIPSEKPGNWQA